MSDFIERKGEISGFQNITDLKVYALAQAILIEAQQAEIARLRELVEGAYWEGRGDAYSEYGKWENSESKTALEQKP